MLEGLVPAACSVFKSAMAPIRLTFKVQGMLHEQSTTYHCSTEQCRAVQIMLHRTCQGTCSCIILELRSASFRDEECHVSQQQGACVGTAAACLAVSHVCVLACKFHLLPGGVLLWCAIAHLWSHFAIVSLTCWVFFHFCHFYTLQRLCLLVSQDCCSNTLVPTSKADDEMVYTWQGWAVSMAWKWGPPMLQPLKGPAQPPQGPQAQLLPALQVSAVTASLHCAEVVQP